MGMLRGITQEFTRFLHLSQFLAVAFFSFRQKNHIKLYWNIFITQLLFIFLDPVVLAGLAVLRPGRPG